MYYYLKLISFTKRVFADITVYIAMFVKMLSDYLESKKEEYVSSIAVKEDNKIVKAKRITVLAAKVVIAAEQKVKDCEAQAVKNIELAKSKVTKL